MNEVVEDQNLSQVCIVYLPPKEILPVLEFFLDLVQTHVELILKGSQATGRVFPATQLQKHKGTGMFLTSLTSFSHIVILGHCPIMVMW